MDKKNHCISHSGNNKSFHWEAMKRLCLPCEFHADTVTARTISRLSRGVARMSASDEPSKAISLGQEFECHEAVSENRTVDVIDFNNQPKGFRGFFKGTNTDPFNLQINDFESFTFGHKYPQNYIKTNFDQISSSYLSKKKQKYNKNPENNYELYTEMKTSPGNDVKRTQSSKEYRTNETLPLTTGLKRTFSRAMEPYKRCSPSTSYPLNVSPYYMGYQIINCNIRPNLSIHRPTLHYNHPSTGSKEENPFLCKNKNSKTSCSLHKSILSSGRSCSHVNNYSVIGSEKISSNSSTVSLSPQHPCMSHSSSPTMSTSDGASENQNMINANRRQKKSRRVQPRTQSTDMLRLRLSRRGSDFGNSAQLRGRNHRAILAGSTGDDSSDGPLYQRKKARICFMPTSRIKCIVDPTECPFTDPNLKAYHPFKSVVFNRICQSKECFCRLRHSLSSSPRQRKKHKSYGSVSFRYSLLEGASLSQDTLLDFSGELSPNKSFISNENNREHSSIEGDDECSDDATVGHSMQE